MKPETQIQIGRLTAIMLAAKSMLIIVGVFVITWYKFSDPADYKMALRFLVLPIVLSNILSIIFFVSFFFTLGGRFLKTSLFLLIVYFLFVVWSFLTAEYFDIFADSFIVIFQTLVIFLLSLGVFGVYREKHMADDK